MEVASWIWLGIIVLFLVAELATVQLVSVWFIIGSVCAFIAALFDVPVLVQIIIFFGVSILALLLLRPMLKSRIDPALVATNADRVIGKIGIVKETVDNEMGLGRVCVEGLEWTARSYSGAVIPEGDRVGINAIEGVKLIVYPIQKEVQ